MLQLNNVPVYDRSKSDLEGILYLTMQKIWAIHKIKNMISDYGLALYEDDATSMPLLSAFLKSFTTPGPAERDASAAKQRKVSASILFK